MVGRLAQWYKENRMSRGAELRAFLVFAAAATCAFSQAPSTRSRKAPPFVSEDPGTRSITLPGTGRSAGEPQTGPLWNAVPEPNPSTIAAGTTLSATEALGDLETERHYRTAVFALKEGNLAIAADEMTEAARQSPENALVLYGLAVVEARNQQPELALKALEKAMVLGLPKKESAEAEDLMAAIRYSIRKSEADQKKITPAKLWGTYDAGLEEARKDAEELPGRVVFKTWEPVSREVSLWKIEGETAILGHWFEKNTYTEETVYANIYRHDPKPKTSSEEHWWVLGITINPDGSLEGRRLETCSRQDAHSCEPIHDKPRRVVTFTGRLELNGDLTIVQADGTPIVLRKKSRLSTQAPPEAGIRLD